MLFRYPFIMGKEIDDCIKDDDDDEVIVPKKKRRKQLVDSDEENEPTAAEIIITSSESEASASSSDEAEDEDDSEGSGESESEYDSDSDETSSEISEDTPLVWEAVFIDGDLGTTSEAEEGRLQERFDSAMKLIGNSRVQEGFELLCSILKEPLIQKQRTADVDSIDWVVLKTTYNPHLESKMRTLAFSVYREIARITTKPIGFYIQALAIRPVDRRLWYEFGCAAAKQRDWKWAEMAFKECQQDPDAVLKLILVYFYSEQYHSECFLELQWIRNNLCRMFATFVFSLIKDTSPPCLSHSEIRDQEEEFVLEYHGRSLFPPKPFAT